VAYTTIDDPSAYFQAATWSGSASTDTITFGGNSDLQLDWLWTKCRSNGHSHALMDTSRITGGDYLPLFADTTDVEQTAYDSELQSITSDGFTVGTQPHAGGDGKTYVGFAWKANGGTTASNTSGSLTSTVQANTDAGFSIITYTGNNTGGSTIGHGLGAVPEWIMTKSRVATKPWQCYHKSIGNDHFIDLDSTNAKVSASASWSNTTPTSSIVTLGNGDTNHTGAMVAYCFSSIQGYSKFGSFEGNNNADGPFIYTGFKPAWVMTKNVDASGKVWFVWDNARDIDNVTNHTVSPDGDGTEQNDSTGAENRIDMLSNGFKIRATGTHINPDGQTLIYIAFAEQPFVSSEGVPTTAR